MKPKLLCILGESASGKDSITKAAIQKITTHDVRAVCSYTDRPIRDDETNGVQHYFVSTKEFNAIKKERSADILAYTCIRNKKVKNSSGYQYMALTDELYKAQIYIIDYDGYKDLKSRYGDSVELVLVYIHAPLEERKKRAEMVRSDFKAEFQKRILAEEEQFKIFRQARAYDYKIDNGKDKFDRSVNKLCTIINYEIIGGSHLNSPRKLLEKTNS